MWVRGFGARKTTASSTAAANISGFPAFADARSGLRPQPGRACAVDRRPHPRASARLRLHRRRPRRGAADPRSFSPARLSSVGAAALGDGQAPPRRRADRDVRRRHAGAKPRTSRPRSGRISRSCRRSSTCSTRKSRARRWCTSSGATTSTSRSASRRDRARREDGAGQGHARVAHRAPSHVAASSAAASSPSGTPGSASSIVHGATQFPHIVRTGPRRVPRVPRCRIRVVSPDVGGGFGYKAILAAEEVCAVLAGHALRPAGPLARGPARAAHRQRQLPRASLRDHGLRRRDGKDIGLRCEATVDSGAYSAYPFTRRSSRRRSSAILPGPYDFPVYRCRTTAVATNKPPHPALPRRRPHRRLLRHGADDRRHRPADRQGALRSAPRQSGAARSRCRTTTSRTSISTAATTRKSCAWRSRRSASTAVAGPAEARRGGWPPDRSRHSASTPSRPRTAPPLRRRGAACLATSRPARLTPDGGLEVRVGIHSIGQGLETTLAQVASEFSASIPPRSASSTEIPSCRPIRLAPGARAAWSWRAAPTRARLRASWPTGSAKSAPGCCRRTSTSVAVRDGARRRPARQRHRSPRSRAPGIWRPQDLPGDVDPHGLEVTAGYKPKRDTGTFSYAAHAAVVAVDPETGGVEILDYVVVEDGGVLVNPMIVDGQIHRRHRPGHRHRALRGDAVRRAGPAAGLDARRLPAAGRRPRFPTSASSTWRPRRPIPSSGRRASAKAARSDRRRPSPTRSTTRCAPLGVELCEIPITPRRILEALATRKQAA